jgi:Phosphotransferase enzyme family
VGSLRIPATIDEVDSAWLETTMHEHGAVAAPRIDSFAVEKIGVGVGFMGYLYRVTIDYGGASHDGPRQVIVKLPVEHDVTRQVARSYRFYEKEVQFYNTLGSETPLNPPVAYAAIHDVESDDFVLVVEDLGHLRTTDQLSGCSPDDAALAVAALARHHAAFWNDPRFDSPDLAWLPLYCDPPTPEGVVQTFADCWPRFLEVFGDEIGPEIRRVGEWVPAQARALLTPLAGHPLTLTHGDFRMDNLFFHDDGAVSAIDWQICAKGPGGYDFAYFVSQSLTIDDRRAQWDRLAAIYLDTLAAAGAVYPPDQFWLDVKRTLLFCLVYPVQVASLDLSDPHSLELLLEIGARAMRAILECDTLALIEA